MTDNPHGDAERDAAEQVAAAVGEALQFFKKSYGVNHPDWAVVIDLARLTLEQERETKKARGLTL